MNDIEQSEESGLADAFSNEYERVTEECADYLNQCGVSFESVLNIGEWSRLKLLERWPGADEYLTKEDLDLLQAEGRYFKEGAFVFCPDIGALSAVRVKQAKAWHEASHKIRNLCYPIFMKYMIDCGMVSIDEAVLSFAVANQLIAFHSMDSKETDGEWIERRVKDVISTRNKVASAARFGQPGGTWEKHDKIRQAWLSGEYESRRECAEVMAKKLSISFSAARKVLIGLPGPV